MTPEAYRAQLARLGLTQAACARLVGVEPRTSERWAAGKSDVPPPVQRLLWLCETMPGVAEALGGFEQ